MEKTRKDEWSLASHATYRLHVTGYSGKATEIGALKSFDPFVCFELGLAGSDTVNVDSWGP